MAEQESLVEKNQREASEADTQQRSAAEANQERSSTQGQQVMPGEAGAEPSGYRGDNPSTAGTGQTEVKSSTPENKLGHLNPSAPEDVNVTPGSTTEK